MERSQTLPQTQVIEVEGIQWNVTHSQFEVY